jgi:branched-chain amino acid transport system substrate-binding protein
VIRKTVVTIGLLALALMAAGCGDGSGSADAGGGADGSTLNLKIGFSGDFSGGPFAAYDVPVRNGMQMAAKQINAEGAADGVKVEIVTKDNKGDSSLAATTTQELVDDGVLVQVLTTIQEASLGRLVTDAGGIIEGGMVTTPELIRDIGDRSFSFLFSDPAQAAVAAQYSCDQGYKTAYTLAGPEYAYTKWMPVYFKDAFKHTCGGEVVGEDVYKLGETDFGPNVTKIANLNPKPDVIFSPIFIPDTGAFLKQLRGAGVTTPFVSGDGNDTSLLVDSAGTSADGMVFTAHGAAVPGSDLETFYAEYKALMGEQVESYTFEAIGRDAVYGYVEAAKQAKSVDPDDVLEAVMSLKNVPLLTGELQAMDPKTRFAVKPVFLVSMDGTERTFPDPVVPEYIPAAQ